MLRRVLACSKRVLFNVTPISRVPILNTYHIAYKFSTKPPSSGEEYEKVKEQGKQFYQTQVQKIIQLKSSSEFEKVVLAIQQPIVLDLYADWCQPCKKLTPRLQSKINSMEKVKMIKVNIDKCPEIAHALQVKSVPTVYLLFQGQAVDRIQGNVSDQQLDKFFGNIAKITGVNQQNKEAVDILQKAKLLIAEKKCEEAIPILENFSQKKISADLIAIKQLFLAQCYFSTKKLGKFKQAILRAGAYEQFFNQAPQLNQFYQIMKSELQKQQAESKQDPKLHELQQRLAQNQQKSDRLQTKFELLNYYKSKQLNQNALETAMQIIKEDKEWENKKTNKLVLAIFKQLGNNSPLVQKYRKIMQRLIS